MRGALAPHIHILILGRTVANRRSLGRIASNGVDKENTARSGTTSFSPGTKSEEGERSEFTRML